MSLTPCFCAAGRLLKDGLKDSQFSIRYQYLLAALLCCCGKGLREEFDRQCLLVNTLARLAQQVRDAAPSARQVSIGVIGGLMGSSWVSAPRVPPQGILREGLEEVKQFFKANGSCRLPLSPSLLVKGIVPRVSAGAGGAVTQRGPAGSDGVCFPSLAAGLLLFQLQRRPPEALLPERRPPRGKYPGHLQGELILRWLPKPWAPRPKPWAPCP